MPICKPTFDVRKDSPSLISLTCKLTSETSDSDPLEDNRLRSPWATRSGTPRASSPKPAPAWTAHPRRKSRLRFQSCRQGSRCSACLLSPQYSAFCCSIGKGFWTACCLFQQASSVADRFRRSIERGAETVGRSSQPRPIISFTASHQFHLLLHGNRSYRTAQTRRYHCVAFRGLGRAHD